MSRPEPEYVCCNHYRNISMRGANSGTGTAYLTVAPTFTLVIFRVGGCSILSFLCIILQSIVFFLSFFLLATVLFVFFLLTTALLVFFSIDHCIVFFFLWILYCLSFFFWLLYCLSFCHFSFGYCIICPFSFGYCIVCPFVIFLLVIVCLSFFF